MSTNTNDDLEPFGTLLTTPITTEAQAVEWIHAMERSGYGSHPDNSGATIGNTGPDGEWVRLYTDEQAEAYDARWEEVFGLVEDPYGVSLDAFHATHPEAKAEA